MNITNMIKRRDEDPEVAKDCFEIMAFMKDGLCCSLERFPMNPYEAIFVLESYLVEKELKTVRDNRSN